MCIIGHDTQDVGDEPVPWLSSLSIACLAADGKLAEGEPWVQESIIGSLFTGRFRWQDKAAGTILPTIIGSAFVNAEATLLLDDADPFCWGIK